MQRRKRQFIVLGLAAGLGYWLTAGCGGAGAPTGSGSTPTPIELPSAMSFPSSLSVSTSSLASSSTSLPLGKALSGTTDLDKALSVATTAQTHLDALLALLSGLTFNTESTVTSAIGTTAAGGVYSIDFSAFNFSTFSSQSLTSVDCSATCSGHAGTMPICVRLSINGQRMWVGKFTNAVNGTSKGAGCFRTVSANTTTSSESALVNGTESSLISGVWEQTDPNNLSLEMYWSTTTEDASGIKIATAHALLTDVAATSSDVSLEKSSSGSGTLSVAQTASYTDAGTSKTLSARAATVKGSGVVQATYTIDGSSQTDACVTSASGASSSGCAASVPSAVTEATADDVGIGTTTLASTQPAVSAMTPTTGSTFNAITGTTVTLTFSEAMNPLTTTTFTVTESGGTVVSGTVTNPSSTSAVFTPSSTLKQNTTYTVAVTTGATGTSGTAITAYSGTFSTGRLGVSAGYGHSLAVKSNGVAYGWGVNTFGQLGNGTSTNATSPQQITSLSQVIAVAACNGHSIFLKSDGTVWAAGSGTVGQLGNSASNSSTSVVQVSSLTGVTAISCQHQHNLALKSDGTVWAWGWNASDGNAFQGGQLGDATTTNRNAPVQVSGLTSVVAISAGFYHSAAVKSDGTAWAWGANGVGQICHSDVGTRQTTPQQITSITTAVGVAAGANETIFILSDGSLRYCGNDERGESGQNSEGVFGSSSPTAVKGVGGSGTLSGMSTAEFGSQTVLAVASDGSLYMWGRNATGELGDGTSTNRATPITRATSLFTSASGATVISASIGDGHTLVVTSDGTYSGTGANSLGELGDGTTTSRTTPVSTSSF